MDHFGKIDTDKIPNSERSSPTFECELELMKRWDPIGYLEVAQLEILWKSFSLDDDVVEPRISIDVAALSDLAGLSLENQEGEIGTPPNFGRVDSGFEDSSTDTKATKDDEDDGKIAEPGVEKISSKKKVARPVSYTPSPSKLDGPAVTVLRKSGEKRKTAEDIRSPNIKRVKLDKELVLPIGVGQQETNGQK